jgi:hypothetical protein
MSLPETVRRLRPGVRRFVVFAIAVGAVLWTAQHPSAAEAQLFTATLTGAQQVPAVVSAGTGTGTVLLNAAEDQITVNLSFSGLSSAANAAHIHGPAAAGANAGVLFDFAAVVPAATSGSIPPQTFAISPAQVAELKAGLYYFNIHTGNFSGGEIRGQIGFPAITTQPVNQSVPAGANASFTVAASGAPAPSYQWQISFGGPTFTNLTNDPPYSGVTTPTLTITAASAGLSGYQYRAIATNSAGSATSDAATLTVTAPSGPLAPSGLTATAAGFTRIRLAWTASSGATSYIVKRSTTPGAETPLATGVTATSYTDATAVKGQLYYYVVSAVNGGGESPNSAEVAAATPNRLAPLDFDGDGKGDLTHVRPSTFSWNTLQSQAGFTTNTSVQWGLPGDVPVPGDYDGDGVIDPAVYRPSNGTWYALLSGTDLAVPLVVSFGLSADIPVPGDYDGDGRTDPAVYRPSTSTWFVLKSSTGVATQTTWGLPGDVPVAADYDGDGKMDPAVYRPWTGTWFTIDSGTGYNTVKIFTLGVSMDRPVPGDYDGDGKADPAVYRPSTGTWLLLASSAPSPAVVLAWGLPGDLPAPADYNGDGSIDLAIYRPSSGQWYVLMFSGSSTSSFVLASGQSDDVPLPIAVASQPRSEARRLSDVDLDGKADLTVFRPSTGEWFTLTSSSGYGSSMITQWGLPGDVPVPGDYERDGTANRVVFRPSTGTWFVHTPGSSGSGFFMEQWGLSTDTPVPGDYEGDGTTDPAIYRPATGQWFIRLLNPLGGSSQVIQWGLPGDTPVANDYDGDNKTDPAVYRPSTGTWYLLESKTGYTTSTVIQWGLDTDITVPGDYDGDGKGDLAVFRPSTGQWFLRFSGSNFTTSQVVQWGLPNDLAVPLDYDGDGKTDLAVYRPATGTWYVLMSTSGYTTSFTRQWGLSSDVPILKR